MEGDILNYSPTVMFRWTYVIKVINLIRHGITLKVLASAFIMD